MTALQEYYLEIKPTKMAKGKILCLLEAQLNNPEKEQQWIQEEDMCVDTIDVASAPSSGWYDDIKFYLIHEYTPPTLEFKKHRTL